MLKVSSPSLFLITNSVVGAICVLNQKYCLKFRVYWSIWKKLLDEEQKAHFLIVFNLVLEYI